MENNKHFQGKRNRYLRLSICLIACFACGILDGYTLIFKGFFGMLQTGNLVNSIMYLALGQYEYLLLYASVIAAFMGGLLMADLIEDISKKKNIHAPFIFTIISLILITIIIFIPSSFDVSGKKFYHDQFDYKNIISNCLFAIIGALMYRTFFTFEATNFSSAMMTANLSRFSHAFYQGVFKKDKRNRIIALDYCLIVLCYLSGVVLYGLFHKFYVLKSFSGENVVTILPNLILIIPLVLVFITIILNHFSGKEIKKEALLNN